MYSKFSLVAEGHLKWIAELNLINILVGQTDIVFTSVDQASVCKYWTLDHHLYTLK